MNSFGIKNDKIVNDEHFVFCTNCAKTYYENITDERNNNTLKLFFDKNKNEFYKGCPECKTDKYLNNEILV